MTHGPGAQSSLSAPSRGPGPGLPAAVLAGKHRGIVVDNEDPRGMGRLRALVPGLLADVETGWALPCVPYAGDSVGLLAIPPVGAGVWIEFEAGQDLSRPVWSGCWWGEGQAPEGAAPAKKLLRTDGGHTILIDEEEGRIEVAHADGSTITIDGSHIEAKHADGAALSLDGSAIEAKHPGGASVKVDGSGVELSHSGRKVKVSASGVSLNDGALEVA